MKELSAMSVIELLQTHSAVIDELRCRGVLKTRNNPVGDYTEWLACSRLNLQGQGNSQRAFDAIDHEDIRYQIKGRRSTAQSVLLSPIRNLNQHGFDFVIAVIFNDDYSIRLAVKVNYDAVQALAKYRAYVNGHILTLTDNVVEQDGVENIGNLLS